MTTKLFSELKAGDLIYLNSNVCSASNCDIPKEVIRGSEALADKTWVVWVEEFGRYYGYENTVVSTALGI